MKEVTQEELISFHNKIAQKVKAIRKEKGLTQLDLAKVLGFENSSFISHVENLNKIEYKYSLSHLYILSQYLKIDIEEFLK